MSEFLQNFNSWQYAFIDYILRAHLDKDISNLIIEYSSFDPVTHTPVYAIQNDYVDIFLFTYEEDKSRIEELLLSAVRFGANKIVKAICQKHTARVQHISVHKYLTQGISIDILRDLLRNASESTLELALSVAVNRDNVDVCHFLISEKLVQHVSIDVLILSINRKHISLAKKLISRFVFQWESAKMVLSVCIRQGTVFLDEINYILSQYKSFTDEIDQYVYLSKDNPAVLRIFKERGVIYSRTHLLCAYRHRYLRLIRYLLYESDVTIGPDVVAAAARSGLLEDLCVARGPEELQKFGPTILFFIKQESEKHFAARVLKSCPDDMKAAEMFKANYSIH
jgi:hypothetical protein